jgi:hypothetical protein
LLGVSAPAWAWITAPDVTVASLTVTKVPTWSAPTLPQPQHLVQQDVEASSQAAHIIVTVPSEYADAVYDVRYTEETPWMAGTSHDCVNASATRYECGYTGLGYVRVVRVSWHLPKLAAHLTGSSLTATVTAEASMGGPGDAQSGSGTLTLRPSVDVALASFQPGPTADGSIGLATVLSAPTGQQLPPGTLRITGYGAKPANLGTATWSDGTVTVPVDGSVAGHSAFLSAPLASDWQTRAFSATLTSRWADPNAANNTLSSGPVKTGGGGTGSGGSGGSPGGGGATTTPGAEPTASGSAAASSSAGATTTVTGRAQPPPGDGAPTAAPAGGLGAAMIVTTATSVALLGALAGAGWWWVRRRRGAGGEPV